MTELLADLRSFGRAEDLDLDLGRAARPAAVTEVLARCSRTADSDTWWAQPVGRRIAALLRIVALTSGTEAMRLRLRCEVETCRQSFEIMLPIDALCRDHVSSEELSVTLPEGQVVTVRRPTGADQRTWLRREYGSAEEAIAAMVETLVVDGHLTPSVVPAVSEALAAQDPLVAFTVSCMCPVCGTAGERAIDLEQAALDLIASSQQTLVEDIHSLASRYGWTEREILAVPSSRRAQYRALMKGA